MSFRDLIETAQATALSDKLAPSDEANWLYFCREYSKLFHTPLHLVLDMSPEFVMTQMFSESFSKLDIEEQTEEVEDIVNSLKDREYDIKKERAYREQLKRMVEKEKERLERGEAVHPSLEKDKRVVQPEKTVAEKKLPKSGGINMDLINQLQNEEKITGEF